MAPSLAGTFAATALEGMLRTALRADPATRTELEALAPARLRLDLKGAPTPLTLVFTTDGIRVEADAEAEADAVVQVTPSGLVDLLAGDRERAVLSGAVRIEGDGDLAMTTLAVLARFSPDLEGPLSRLVGETPTAVFGTAARRGRAEARRAAQGTAAAARDILTAESGPLPSRPEVARFLDEVDDLRLAVDRAEARVARLRARLDEAPE